MPETAAKNARRVRGRLSAGKKFEIVQETLRPDVTLEDAARRHGVTVSQILEWRDRARGSSLEALKERARRDPKDRRIAELERKVGQLTLELDLKKKLQAWIEERRGIRLNSSSETASR